MPLAGYLFAIAFLSISSSGLKLKDRFALMIVLPTMHLGWGLGFIRGYLLGAGNTIDKSRMTKDQLK